MEHECTVRNNCWWMFVHVSVLPSCLAFWAGIGGQSLVFLLFGLQDRSLSLTHSGRERGDDSMVWCWLKEPKEEHSLYVVIVFLFVCFAFCFFFSSGPGNEWRRNQFVFRSLHLLLCPRPSLSTQHQTWHGSHDSRPSCIGQGAVCGRPGFHGDAGRIPKADTSVSFGSPSSRVYAES